MTPEWKSRLAAMVQGFHADMAAHDRGEPLPLPPLIAMEEPAKIRNIKCVVGDILAAASHPLTMSEIIDAVERRFPNAPNIGSVRGEAQRAFASARVALGGAGKRNRPRFAYILRQAAE